MKSFLLIWAWVCVLPSVTWAGARGCSETAAVVAWSGSHKYVIAKVAQVRDVDSVGNITIDKDGQLIAYTSYFPGVFHVFEKTMTVTAPYVYRKVPWTPDLETQVRFKPLDQIRVNRPGRPGIFLVLGIYRNPIWRDANREFLLDLQRVEGPAGAEDESRTALRLLAHPAPSFSLVEEAPMEPEGAESEESGSEKSGGGESEGGEVPIGADRV